MQVDEEEDEQHDELENGCCDNGRIVTGFPVTLEIRENAESYLKILQTGKSQGI